MHAYVCVCVDISSEQRRACWKYLSDGTREAPYAPCIALGWRSNHFLGLVSWSWAEVLRAFIFPLKRERFLPALRVNLSTWKTDYSLPPIHPISVWIVSQKGSWSSVISSFTDCFILAINTSSELKTLYLTPQNFDAPLRKLCLEGRPRGPLVSSDAQTHRLTAVHWSSSLEGGLRSM